MRGNPHQDRDLATKGKQTTEHRRLRALAEVLSCLGPEPLTRTAMLRLWHAYARSLDRPTASERTLFLDLLQKVERLRTLANK
jgi:hypothetical protein